MGLEFLGGMANVYNGYKEGQDQELARQQAAADRTYTNEQRVLQRGQQDRVIKQQGIDDANAEAFRNLPTYKEEEVPGVDEIKGDDGVVVTPGVAASTKRTPLTNEEILKRNADHYKATNQSEKYTAAQAAFEKSAFLKTAREMAQWNASNDGAPDIDKFMNAAKAFSDSPNAGKVSNIAHDESTGMVSFDTSVNGGPVTRQSMPLKTALSSITTHFTPEGWTAIQAAKAKQAGIIEKETIKGQFGLEGRRITAAGQIEGRRITAAARGLGGAGGISSSGEDREVLAARKESADSVKSAEKFLQDAMIALQPGMKSEDSEAVKLATAGLQRAKFNHGIVEIKTSSDPERSAAEKVLGVAANTADIMKSLNQLHSVFGPSFTDNVGALVMESDSFKQMVQSEKKPPPAPGQQATTPDAKKSGGTPVPWKDRLSNDEKQFANVASKSGWEPYAEKYGVWGVPAYRKSDGNGGWITKTATDLAKELGVLY